MALVHPTALVEPGAEIADDVLIGPFCHVGADVRLGSGSRLLSHVVIAGHTTLGPGCLVYPFASLGHPPQDLKYRGERSALEIGAGCTIREHVTMNPGTAGGGLVTRVGEGCLVMAGAHVAHDCEIGASVVLANGVTLGGHVTIGDHAVLGGLVAVHQHVRIGAHAMVGGLSGVESDVIPYGSAIGNRACLAGLNLVGMRRRGIARDEILALRRAFRLLFTGEGSFADRLALAGERHAGAARAMEVIRFIQAPSRRALCRPRRAGAV